MGPSAGVRALPDGPTHARLCEAAADTLRLNGQYLRQFSIEQARRNSCRNSDREGCLIPDLSAVCRDGEEPKEYVKTGDGLSVSSPVIRNPQLWESITR